VGSGNHTGTDHSDFDRIHHVWDYQCSHGWLAYEDVVDVNRWEFAVSVSFELIETSADENTGPH
jgi:hypothetical protein